MRAVVQPGDQLRGFDGPFMQIIVRDNNVDQALRALKKKLQREGVYREMKLRRHYGRPQQRGRFASTVKPMGRGGPRRAARG